MKPCRDHSVQLTSLFPPLLHPSLISAEPWLLTPSNYFLLRSSVILVWGSEVYFDGNSQWLAVLESEVCVANGAILDFFFFSLKRLWVKVFLETFIFILVFLKTHLNSDPAHAYPALVYSKHSIKHFGMHCICPSESLQQLWGGYYYPIFIPQEAGSREIKWHTASDRASIWNQIYWLHAYRSLLMNSAYRQAQLQTGFGLPESLRFEGIMMKENFVSVSRNRPWYRKKG